MALKAKQPLWNYFHVKTERDKHIVVECSVCKETLTYKSRNGPRNLRAHLKKVHGDIYKKLSNVKTGTSVASRRKPKETTSRKQSPILKPVLKKSKMSVIDPELYSAGVRMAKVPENRSNPEDTPRVVASMSRSLSEDDHGESNESQLEISGSSYTTDSIHSETNEGLKDALNELTSNISETTNIIRSGFQMMCVMMKQISNENRMIIRKEKDQTRSESTQSD